jgi:hypothetical protein
VKFLDQIAIIGSSQTKFSHGHANNYASVSFNSTVNDDFVTFWHLTIRPLPNLQAGGPPTIKKHYIFAKITAISLWKPF